MLRQLAARVGVVRATNYAALAKQLQKAREKLGKQGQTIEDLRAEQKQWKVRLSDAEAVADKAKSALASERPQFEQTKAELEGKLRQLATEVDRLRKQAQRQTEIDTLQRRLRDAERELKIAREYLTVLEVKLDLVEAAANVLDGRTRTLTVRRASAESGAMAALEDLERRLG